MRVAAFVAFLLCASSMASAHPCPPPGKEVPPVRIKHAPSRDPEARRIEDAGGIVKSNFVPQGQKEKYGHAEVVVHSTLAEVLTQLQAFGQYKDLAPKKFKTSRIVGKEGEDTDVYMQLAIMRGLVTLWQVMRFSPPRVEGDTTTMEGRFIKGNLETARAKYVLRSTGDGRVVVKMDLLIVLPIPAPEDKIDEELRDAAGDAIIGAKEKAEAAHRAAGGTL